MHLSTGSFDRSLWTLRIVLFRGSAGTFGREGACSVSRIAPSLATVMREAEGSNDFKRTKAVLGPSKVPDNDGLQLLMPKFHPIGDLAYLSLCNTAHMQPSLTSLAAKPTSMNSNEHEPAANESKTLDGMHMASIPPHTLVPMVQLLISMSRALEKYFAFIQYMAAH